MGWQWFKNCTSTSNQFIQKHISVAVIVAIIAAGFAGWQAYEAADAGSNAEEAISLAKQANELLTVSLEPKLEPILWYSYSIDLRDEKDLRLFEIAGIWARKGDASWQDVEAKADSIYGWLLILNNGEGSATIGYASSFKYIAGSQEMVSEPWTDSIQLRTGQALALFLGPCGQLVHTAAGDVMKLDVNPEMVGDIQVHYETAIPDSGKHIVALRLPVLYMKYLGEQGPEWTF